MTPTLSRLTKDPVMRIALIFSVLLAIFPLICRDETIIFWFVRANWLAIFAMALDLLMTSGYMSFGHQAYFCVAAYAAGMAYLFLGIPTSLGLIIGPLAALAFGIPIGIACLKWRGPYLILATSIFPAFVSALIVIGKDYTGGYQELPGLIFPGKYLPPFIETPDWLLNTIIIYYISLALMAGSAITLLKLVNSNFGLIISAIRDNELAAEACGINTTRYKIICFCMSVIFAGLAAAFYTGNVASMLKISSTNDFSIMMDAFFAIIVGGIWSIYGAIGGAYILTAVRFIINQLYYSFPILPYIGTFITLSIMVLILYFLPEGVLRRVHLYLRYKSAPKQVDNL